MEVACEEHLVENFAIEIEIAAATQASMSDAMRGRKEAFINKPAMHQKRAC